MILFLAHINFVGKCNPHHFCSFVEPISMVLHNDCCPIFQNLTFGKMLTDSLFYFRFVSVLFYGFSTSPLKIKKKGYPFTCDFLQESLHQRFQSVDDNWYSIQKSHLYIMPLLIFETLFVLLMGYLINCCFLGYILFVVLVMGLNAVFH